MKHIIKNKLRENNSMMLVYSKIREFYYKIFFNEKSFIEKRFKKNIGRELDLKHPTKYCDKLQWLKFHWRDPLAEKVVDKYEVRDHIIKSIGDEYLNDLIEVYENVDEIDISELPNSFVLKGTHGSGYNIICKDKTKVNWKNELNKVSRWLNTNYYWLNREWVYKNLKPRIVCEKFLEDSNGKPPMDYKFFCFHGEPKIIQVDIDRFGGHKQNFYDIDWNFRDVEIWCDNDVNTHIPKPENFELMLELSRKLSKPFPQVRVDLYNVDGKIIFGELTFFHLSGLKKFRSEELELQMGNWLDLSTINEAGEYKYY